MHAVGVDTELSNEYPKESKNRWSELIKLSEKRNNEVNVLFSCHT